MTAKTDVLGYYADMFKGWQAAAGTKPTAEMLATVHALGARPGKQAMANAMYLRPAGATSGQVVMVVGAVQLNKLRTFISDGLLKRDAVPASAAGHTVYKASLTAKGAAKVKAINAAAAKAEAPAKPKGNAKQAPAKPTAPQAPANPAAAGNEVHAQA